MSSSKGSIHFFRTTILGGLVFMLPVVVLVVVVTKAVNLMMKVAKPMAAWIPLDSVGGVALADVIVGFALVLICFAAGLATRGSLVRVTIGTLESRLLSRLPGYDLVRGMLSGLSEDDNLRLFPVLATFGATARFRDRADRR